MVMCTRNVKRKLPVRQLALWLGLSLALACGAAAAQPTAVKGQAFQPQGTLPDGQVYNPSRLKGKVAMVFYWSTSCSVCLSHMPELRANAAGWRGKPFELVTVNVDATQVDWKAYEQIAAKTQMPDLVPIWAGKGSTQKLPVTLVLDVQGKVAARYEGRIAPEAWDAVAEILP